MITKKQLKKDINKSNHKKKKKRTFIFHALIVQSSDAEYKILL